MLNRESILGQKDLPSEVVDVPEWGGSIIVRTMTGTERDSFESSHLDAKGNGNVLVNIRARLVARTAYDGNGERIFKDADADALGKTSNLALDRIFSIAQRLNGIGANEVDELQGN